ncbi:MarR family winged helix-turn-helix transcriptional regulator [Serratia marcescens]|uniref:MarR family winged helix-turn-helix transcriptional regulator n=1 Tax=Serratia marcescens TaxID=615 RepID=UPI000CDB3DB3|nr:MarR family transcriptional regulator [Serratia marcescens]POP21275.1 MarR family transcriptional regulator [Serratia marcescens]POP26268.1 MarR family transcriptional regulator [Serratia marcescens]WLS86279.1 MarR family transcriptional regulator [Serratia marcescens]
MDSEKKGAQSGRRGMGLPNGALYRMTEVVRHREKRLSALLALQGLSLHEWRALRILYSFPGDVAMSEVIAHSQTDRTALGRTITQLVNRGWVARFPDPEDKRAVYLRVMPASRPIFDQARQWVADYDAQLMACLDDAGLSALDDALQRMMLFIDHA